MRILHAGADLFGGRDDSGISKAGLPSAVTSDVSASTAMEFSDEEIKERMSGNLCRCGAYVGICDAIREAFEAGVTPMKNFAYARAASGGGMRSPSVREQPNAKFLGGGTNLVDLMRENIEQPDALIDVTRLCGRRRDQRTCRTAGFRSARR